MPHMCSKNRSGRCEPIFLTKEPLVIGVPTSEFSGSQNREDKGGGEEGKGGKRGDRAWRGKGPRDWTNSRSPSGIAIFKQDLKSQANHPQGLVLWGILKLKTVSFSSDIVKSSSEKPENFKRDFSEFRDVRDSRDSSSEKTPFVMTAFSVPDTLSFLCFW